MGKSVKTVMCTNVFENGANGGNPCLVLFEADGLKMKHGQYLAARFSAETVFIVKPKQAGTAIGLRYFVPEYEMEMCVHGTIAAITVLIKNGRVTKSPEIIETALGQTTVEWEDDNSDIRVTVFQFSPEFSTQNPTVEQVCQVLRIPITAIEKEAGPIVSVSTSRPKLIVPIVHSDILDRIEPDFEMLWNLCDQYACSGFYPFAREASGLADVYSARQFPNRAGYNEDPATGVAACALGAFLGKYSNNANGWQYFKVHQGKAMARPSLLEVGIYLENKRITKTKVSGKARVLSKEHVSIPDNVY